MQKGWNKLLERASKKRKFMENESKFSVTNPYVPHKRLRPQKQPETLIVYKTELENLRKERDDLKIQSASKSSQIKNLEEFNAQIKTELEKIKQELHAEVATKTRTPNLENSDVIKAKKLKHIISTKIFSNDPDNEDLETLLNLEVLELFTKYEKIMMRKKDFR